MPNQLLFEVSWEVCNKVGGIYTVIRSKMHQATAVFGDDYFLIGPLLDTNPEFEESSDLALNNVKGRLQGAGIRAKVGRWTYGSGANVILVDYKQGLDQNQLLFQLWEDFGVDSMDGGWEYIEPVLFATTAGKAIAAIAELYGEHRVHAHFHEWIAGAGLLHLKKHCPQIGTVFTCHATVLGRSMAGNGMDLYGLMESVNTDAEAKRLNVAAKHSLESAAAREADCFTTVSTVTAREAEYLLHVKPDLVLPNGFDVRHTKDPRQDPAYYAANRNGLLSFASTFLGQDLDPARTLLVSTSGRYEFRNKGLDVLVDALAGLRAQQTELKRDVVVFILIMAGAVKSSEDQYSYDRYSMLSTHALWDPGNDPILNACFRHELRNDPADRVKIVFVPAFLNGHDGALDLEYYDALAGCDVTVYPSYYEPWGYTPLESIAHGIPTAGTDLSGFGQWILEGGRTDGIEILDRLGVEDAAVSEALQAFIRRYADLPEPEMPAIRAAVRQRALQAEWEIFYPNYLEAYGIAIEECRACQRGLDTRKRLQRLEAFNFRGTDSIRPRFRQLSVQAAIPPELSRLREIANNLWWAWHQDVKELFSRLDPTLFVKLGENPVHLLEVVDPEKLKASAASDNYMQLYETVCRSLDRYLQDTRTPVDLPEDLTPETPVAYFSMEYGLHRSLPVYAGGLGILSGDHIKSASDINLPMVGVGLLYKKGYFQQRIDKNGLQQVVYKTNDFFRMPLSEVSHNKTRLMISVDYPGRTVYARVWSATVGRAKIYFLDTDIPENSPSDRNITRSLYGGEKRDRIEQEIMLGIGGIRLLEALNLNPVVYHLNEGHSAFLIIERLINLIRYNNLTLAEAREVVSASTVFTTHTPVPAGNEVFDQRMIENYLRTYVESHGLAWRDLCDAGHLKPFDDGPFEMTVLALKHTHKRNGVSALHGQVSRHMWSGLWPGLLMEEIPIASVTNGVHAGSWLAKEMKQLIYKYATLNLQNDLLAPDRWERLDQIPDDVLWQTHNQIKSRMLNQATGNVLKQWTREGEDPELLESLLANVSVNNLTIGFARRFATYKRPALVLEDIERIKKILNTDQPVQIIFAGKAHPADTEAYEMIKKVADLAKQREFLGRVLFLENYDMELGQLLVSGCDVWMNNPIRPLEASGTSGQKAGMNGVLNFSILDGWWDEAFDGRNGWAIGRGLPFKNRERQDYLDRETIYEVLENSIIPSYYERNTAGLPEKWIGMMKASMKSIISGYNTHRMLRDYCEKLYLPTVHKFAHRTRDDFAKAREIAAWKQTIAGQFASIHIRNIFIDGVEGDHLSIGDVLSLSLELDSGRMNPEEIRAEMVIIVNEESLEPAEDIGETRYYDGRIDSVPLKLTGQDGTLLSYSGAYTVERSGKMNYGVRVLPYHPDVENIYDLNLMYWG